MKLKSIILFLATINFSTFTIKPASIEVEATNLGKQLITAAEEGNTTQVQDLLAANADTNTSDTKKTALMAEVFFGHTETLVALLTAGADIDAKNNNSDTALIWAAKAGHTEIAEILLENKANLPSEEHFSRL